MTQPTLPGYRIVKSLSESKRAHVYLAEQQSLQRLVALKVLSGEVSTNEAQRKRVIEEGKAAARLTHPNLLSVFDIGEAGGCDYIATEYVSGGTLRDRLANGPIAPDKALLIARDLVTGLKFLHSQGFLHRDIKPTNVFFREDGTALLGEAGMARAASGKTPENEQVAFGSPHYMSPERAQAMPSDGRSDQYSLGVVIWEALTGSPPFDADDPFQVAIKHISEAVPALPLPLAALQPIMARCLAKQPEQRFASANDLLLAIDALLQARGISTTQTAPSNRPAPAPVAPTNAPLPSKNAAQDSEVTQPFNALPQANAPQKAAPPQPELGATAVLSPLTRPSPVDAGTPTAIVQPVPAPEPKRPIAPPVPAATVLGQKLPNPEQTVALPLNQVRPPPAQPFAPPMPADSGATSINPAFAPPAVNQGAFAPPAPFSMPASTVSTSAPPVATPVTRSDVKRSGAAGWLIWIGVLGLICAAAAAWWVLKGSKEQSQLEAPKPGSSQLGNIDPPKTANPAPSPSPATSANTVEELAEKARSAYAAGDYVNPTDQCAAFYYQEILKQNPDDADAQLGLQATADGAEAQIRAALEDGTQSKARAFLDAALVFFPEQKNFVALKAQFAAAP
jgi:serine/threonine protein kinase